MKIIKSLLLLVCLLNIAFAQNLGIYGSLVQGEDIEKDLYGVGLKAQIPLSDSFFVVLRATRYSEYSEALTIGPLDLPARIDADFTPIDIGIGWQKSISEALYFFADVGFSYLISDGEFSVTGFPGTLKMEDDEGWYSNIGVRHGKEYQFFAEIQFRNVDGKVNTDGLPPTLSTLSEFPIKHLSLNVGVAYQW